MQQSCRHCVAQAAGANIASQFPQGVGGMGVLAKSFAIDDPREHEGEQRITCFSEFAGPHRLLVVHQRKDAREDAVFGKFVIAGGQQFAGATLCFFATAFDQRCGRFEPLLYLTAQQPGRAAPGHDIERDEIDHRQEHHDPHPGKRPHKQFGDRHDVIEGHDEGEDHGDRADRRSGLGRLRQIHAAEGEKRDQPQAQHRTVGDYHQAQNADRDAEGSADQHAGRGHDARAGVSARGEEDEIAGEGGFRHLQRHRRHRDQHTDQCDAQRQVEPPRIGLQFVPKDRKQGGLTWRLVQHLHRRHSPEPARRSPRRKRRRA